MSVKSDGMAEALTAGGYDVATRDDAGGRSLVSARNGSKLVTLTVGRDRIHAAAWIDYGPDGRSWSDGRDYRTPRGALTFARNFLGAPR